MKTKAIYLTVCFIILISGAPGAQAQTSDVFLLPATQTKISRLAPDVALAETSFKADDVTRIEFKTISNRNHVVVSVIAPNGQVINSGNVSNFGGTYNFYEVPENERGEIPLPDAGAGFHYDFSFNSQGAGIYTVRYESSEPITGETVLMTKLMTDTELRVKFFTLTPTVNIRQHVAFALALFNGSAPITGADVDIAIVLPSGEVVTRELLDNGLQADQAQGDGVYSGFYFPKVAGKFSVMATASGVKQSGVAFELNAGTGFTVLPQLSKLTGTFRDFGVDADDDTFFEKLVVELDTDTTVAGEYGAFVHLKTSGGARLVKAARKNLAVGAGNIQVEFDAESIIKLNENGPYQIERVDLVKYAEDEATTVHILRNLGLTQAYQLSQMQRPNIYFTENKSVTGIDTNGNGKYEALQISAEVKVRETGYYQVLGNLVDANGKFIEQYSSLVFLPSTTYPVNFTFQGTRIVNNGAPGPYHLRDVLIWNDVGDSARVGNLFDTPAYTLDQFDYEVKFTGMNTVSGIDTNNNGKYDILRAEAEVIVNEAAHYHWRADLVDSTGRIIDSFSSINAYLSAATHQIVFDFRGVRISSSGIDGPYAIRNLEFYKINQLGELVNLLYLDKLVDTPAYTADQFDIFARFTGNNIISTLDTNNNGKYDILRLAAEIEVVMPGYYDWQAELIDSSGHLIQRTMLRTAVFNAGIHPVEFDFLGLRIGNNGVDGPYQINVRLLGPDSNEINKNNFIQTSPYSAQQFESGPTLAFIGASTASGVDGDANGKFEFLKIESTLFTANEGAYYISADLFDSQGNLVDNFEQALTLEPGNNAFEFYFDGPKINLNDVSGTFAVKNVFVQTENDSLTVENLLTTQPFLASDFESFPTNLEFFDQSVSDGGSGGDGDNILEPGESGSINVALLNRGTGIARNVSATLTSADPNVTISSASSGYASIRPNMKLANTTPFQITVGAGAARYSNINFTLTVTHDGAATSTFDFSLALGEQNKILYLYSRSFGEIKQIYVMNADGSSKVNLSNSATDDNHPSWSPDGTKIAFTRNIDQFHKIFVMNADGGNQTQLTTAGDCFQPVWSPDNSRIAYLCSEQNGNEIFVAAADGTNVVQVTDSQEVARSGVSWSPNGNKLVYVNKPYIQQTLTSQNPGIFTINPDGTNETQISVASDIEDVRWSPNGNSIAWIANKGYNPSAERTVYELMLINADGTGLRNLSTQTALRAFSWSPDSAKIIFVDDPQNDYSNEVYAQNVTGGAAPTQVIDSTSVLFSSEVEWSPREAKLAVTGEGRSTSACRGIYSADSDGSRFLCLTPASGEYYNPAFKPADPIPPTSTISNTPSANAAGWNTSDTLVGINAMDNQYGGGVQNVRYSAAGAQQIANTVVDGGTATFTVFTEGVTTITYGGKDNANNSEADKTYVIKIDKSSPISQHAASVNGQQTTFTLTATDAISGVSQILYSIDGAAVQTYSAPFTVSNTGGHYVTYYAKDAAGNEETARTVYINAGQVPKSVLISEFRTRGSLGADDEFIELYNNSETPIDISNWTISVKQGSASTPTVLATLNAGTILPARGHYLFRKAGTNNYSLSAYAEADQTYSGALADNIGIALISDSSLIIDAVGFSGVTDTTYREGTALAPAAGIATNGQYSFVRNYVKGYPADSNSNRADFVFVATDGGTYNNLKAVLGAPGPENLSSPIYREGSVLINQIDDKVTLAEAPNRFYDYTAGTPQYPVGVLSVRRKLTNNTGGTINSLKVRITAVTTKNSAVNFPQQAVLRLLNSSDITVTSLDGLRTFPLKGLTIETVPPTAADGGLNSSLTFNLGTNGLANGESVNINIKSGIVTNGQYRLEFRVETVSIP